MCSASAAFSPEPVLNRLDGLCVPEHEPGTVVAQIVGARRLESEPFGDPRHMVAKLDRRLRSPGALAKLKALAGQMVSQCVNNKIGSGPPERSPPSEEARRPAPDLGLPTRP